MDKILFIDYYNFLHRAAIRFDDSSVPDEEVFAFNFFRNLRPIIEQFAPNKCFFALEGHPQFRHNIYAGYKANRITKQASIDKKDSKKENVIKASSIIMDILKLFPVTIAKAKDYEADDLIATLCDNLKNEDLTIISNDSDYIQLLQKKYAKIQIYNPIIKNFQQNTLYPYVVWKSLAGDASDNIPKIVSKNQATELASNPRKLLKFFENEENRANFNINRSLIEFKIIPLEDLIIFDGIGDFAEVKKQFELLKFDSILNKWDKYKNTFNCLTI